MRHFFKGDFRRAFVILLSLVLSMGWGSSALAAIDIDILSATPIGSWAETEQTTSDHKGRESVNSVRMSMLGKEQRNGQTYYWVETVMNSFKVKKGKRSSAGDRFIIKMLVPESSMRGDPASAFANLRGLGEEIIFQNGDSKPMRMSGAGSMAQSMMQMTGSSIDYQFNEQGRENVTVPGGSFDTRILVGTGSATMKLLFKKSTVNSKITSYYSTKVPFGVVRSVGEDTMNGKTSTYTSQLSEYGLSGASSLITETPEEMPAMPNMKDLLGGGAR